MNKEDRSLGDDDNVAEDISSNSLIFPNIKKVALVYTNLGEFQFELFPKEAPKAVENFIYLSRKGYFDNIIFHRVINGFMLQTGDPTGMEIILIFVGDGTGGVSKWNKEFEDEINPDLKHDQPYVVSMANSRPNSNGTHSLF